MSRKKKTWIEQLSEKVGKMSFTEKKAFFSRNPLKKKKRNMAAEQAYEEKAGK